ncbi:MAG: hypothetical protein GX433_16610 [Deltaproteobacteria bacterium]|jgi:dimeric dUTPase (all-alpha-NTP-PPase superfamily)|nr:hypothetical protein [Deltaproteobacteria bacterium]
MQEIFDLQWQLGVHILKNIGLDYENTIRDAEKKPVWIENYRKALSAELAELIREVQEFGIGSPNGKIELVDMLHFLVSLSHIVQVEPSEVSLTGHDLDESAFPSCAIQTFLALDDLQNSLKWKWWAKGGGFKPEKARKAVLDLWKCFGDFCALFHMDLETVKKIYLEKNRINFQRQEQDYNEDTKTETDNRSIHA